MAGIFYDVRGRSALPFRLHCCPRGIGKTYSALQECLEKDGKFIFTRNTERELSSVCGVSNPFKSLNSDMGLDIDSQYSSTLGYGKFIHHGEVIGYSAAISTFASIRGGDFSDVVHWLADEVIPEEHRKNILPHAGSAMLNMYETINRNREVLGKVPLDLVMLCNAIDLDNDILLSIGAVKPISDMIDNGLNEIEIPERGLYISIYKDSKITDLKLNTALYRLAGSDSDFAKMALANEFVRDRLDLVEKRRINIREYQPLIMYDTISIWMHKGDGHLYCSNRKTTAPLVLGKKDYKMLRLQLLAMYEAGLLKSTIRYEDYEIKLKLDDAIFYQARKK